MSPFYLMFSAILIVIPTTGLITKQLKISQFIIQCVVVYAVVYVGITYWGNLLGIPVMALQIGMILIMLREYYLENVILACIGQITNMIVNNIICFAIVYFGNTTLAEFEGKYWLPFCSFYTVLIIVILGALRYVLYKKIKIKNIFEKISVPVRIGLSMNLTLYIVIFYITITMGQRVGYTSKGLLFNCIIFALCLIASSGLIIVCVRSVKTQEQRKAEIQQKEITEKYILSMENMLDDLRAFKHDYKNILSSMAGYIREGNMEDLKSYFSEEIEHIAADSFIQTDVWKSLRNIEPMELKGFLYEKTLLALSHKLHIKLYIENNLNVRCEDMNVLIRILGIFLDNAMEEIEKNSNLEMTVEIEKTSKGVLFTISNDYVEKPEISEIMIPSYSTKGDGRGMGLAWVEKALEGQNTMVHEVELIDGKIVQRLEVINE